MCIVAVPFLYTHLSWGSRLSAGSCRFAISPLFVSTSELDSDTAGDSPLQYMILNNKTPVDAFTLEKILHIISLPFDMTHDATIIQRVHSFTELIFKSH